MSNDITPTVSVVIPNYNYGDMIGATIDSVLGQTSSAHQIIVVDDGSTDRSREVLEGYDDAGHITLILQENAGQAAAISRGVEEATGDVLCLLDSDDFFVPEKIATLQTLYTQHEDVHWIFHPLTLEDADGNHIASNADKDQDDAPRFIDEQSNMRSGDLDYDAPATSGLTFRRASIDELFPLPTAESIYVSDHYIKFYAIADGAGLDLAQPLGIQRIHGNNLYTAQDDKARATKGRIFVNTAYYLRKMKPSITRFCNSIMAEGVSCAHKANIYDEVKERYTDYLSELGMVDSALLKTKIQLKKKL